MKTTFCGSSTWPKRLSLLFAVVLVVTGLPPPAVVAAAPGQLLACTRYVNASATGSSDGTSWTNAYTTLQPAVNYVNTTCGGGEVWVAKGTYTPGSDRTDSFTLYSGVAIYGGFAGSETSLSQRNWKGNVTTLSGEIGAAGNSDNSYHVVFASGVNNTAVLDGFTISSGNANGSSPNSRGGGMYNNSSSPMLTNLTFSNNSAASYGGGMVNEAGSNPILLNSTFRGNAASRGGGMANNLSSPILTNLTFTGNSAVDDGGGMFNSSSEPILINLTITGNSAVNTGGGIYNTSSSPFVCNSILWGNTATEASQVFTIGMSSFPSYDHILIEGVVPFGASNLIFGNPQFVDADGADNIKGTADDNLHLQSTSPAIDQGNNSYLGSVTIDLDGKARIVNDIVDLGAYEYAPSTAVTVSGFEANWQTTAALSLRWTLAAPDGVVGFHLYHSDSPNGERTRVNTEIIAPQARPDYVFDDPQPQPGQAAYYWLEVLRENGSEVLGPVVVPGGFRVYMPVLNSSID